MNRDKKSIRCHTTTIRRECLSKLSPHATRSTRGIKVELKSEVKDLLKVSLVFIFIFFMFWGYSNFDLGLIMILSPLSVCGDGLIWMFKVCAFFWGVVVKEGKKLCKFFFGRFFRKLLVVVEWVSDSVVVVVVVVFIFFYWVIDMVVLFCLLVCHFLFFYFIFINNLTPL